MTRAIQAQYPRIEDFGGKTEEILRFVDPENEKWSAFNPCIAFSPEYGYGMTIRSSNYAIDSRTGVLNIVAGGSMLKSEVWFAQLDQDSLQIVSRQKVKFDGAGPSISRGLEDARLFWRDDSWYFTAVMLEREHTPYSRLALYKYDQTTNTASFVKKYDGHSVFRPEKNWMVPTEPNVSFEFVTDPTTTYKDGTFTSKSSGLNSLGGLRGGTNLLLLKDGTYLSLVHTTFITRFTEFNKNTYAYTDGIVKKYNHQFARFSNNGSLIELSREFVFDSLAIEFAAGLVEKDGQFIITYGRNDQSSHMATVDVDVVMDLLEPADEIYLPIALPKIN
jgi:predicted GH43/DUF377 family glycosyl hydrolase